MLIRLMCLLETETDTNTLYTQTGIGVNWGPLSLWGLSSIVGTKSKSPQSITFNVRPKTWLKDRVKVGDHEFAMITVRVSHQGMNASQCDVSFIYGKMCES